MNDLAPIAIFGFNRPTKLSRLFETIKRAELGTTSRYVVFIDGPRHKQEAELVEESRRVAQQSGLRNLEIRSSNTNKGLRRSIYDGVSSILEDDETVIVLEDDLLLSSVALRYFNDALSFYKDDARAWSVCGYIHDAPALRDLGRTLLLPMAQSWGWATWRSAWGQFNLNAKPSTEVLNSQSFKRSFDLNGVIPFTRMLGASVDGLIDSWFIHWNYTIFSQGGYSVYPHRRVVDNIGIGAGTHGGRLNPTNLLVKSPPLLETLPTMKEPGDIDYPALDYLRTCREVRVHRAISLAGYVKRRLAYIGRDPK